MWDTGARECTVPGCSQGCTAMKLHTRCVSGQTLEVFHAICHSLFVGKSTVRAVTMWLHLYGEVDK